MKSMNHYAYVYIGIAESTTFFGASIDASQLLNTREKETLVNDLLIPILLIKGKIICRLLWIFYRIDFYITCGQRCDHSIRFVCLGTRCI